MLVPGVLVATVTTLLLSTHSVAQEPAHSCAENTHQRVAAAQDASDESTGKRPEQAPSVGSENVIAAVAEISTPAAATDVRVKAKACA